MTYVYDIELPSRYTASIQILQTCHALVRSGLRVRVLVTELAGDPGDCLAYYGLEPIEGLTIEALRGGRWGSGPGSALRPARAGVRAEQPHVIMSRGESACTLFGRRADRRNRRRRPGERWVYEAHRLSRTKPGRGSFRHVPLLGPAAKWHRDTWLRLRERRVLRRVDGLVCLTGAVEAELDRVHGITAPSLVLPSGTVAPAASLPGESDRDLDVLYCGKLETGKGVPVLLAAMADVEDATLWIAGGTARQVEAMRARAESLGAGERVRFLGHVPRGRLAGLLRRARVGVCPNSRGDRVAGEFSSPMKLLDYLAHGVPAVASDVPAVRRLLGSANAALLVPPDDAGALAAGIRLLLTDRVAATRFARRGQAIALRHSWDRRAEDLGGFLDRL